MADTTVGAKLVIDDAQARQALKNVKNDLKAAQGELLLMTEKFGATSKQALDAAKKVAQLKDTLQDAAEMSKLFDPGNRFAVLGNSVRGLVGGFTALQGALALAGVEGEDLQKTLLKVQGALAITEGLNVIADVGKNLKQLGAVLVQTLGRSGLVGVAVAGIAALAISVRDLFSSTSELEKSLDSFNKGAAEAITEVTDLRNSFDLARRGVISKTEALNKYNNGLGKVVGQAKNLDEAERLTAENADNYIKVQGLKAQANFLLAKSAEITAQIMIEQQRIEKGDIAGTVFERPILEKLEVQKKQAEDLLKLVADINIQIQQAAAGFKPINETQTKSLSSSDKKDVYNSMRDGIVKTTDALKEHQSTIRETSDLKTKLDNEAIASDNAYTLNFLKNKSRQNQETQAQLLIEEYAALKREQLAASIGKALGALSDLVGKQTAAGKVLAIAEATINTYLAASNILKNTARNPVTGAVPGFAIAQMIATIAAGLITVRNIIKTPVPGASNGQAPGAVPAPLQAQIPQSTRTRLDADQINQIGNATVRAFVVETDITNNQDRIRRLNRQARI